eukprot:scaffold220377_cov30-Prasinocladus_malaysianus.AAC.1
MHGPNNQPNNEQAVIVFHCRGCILSTSLRGSVKRALYQVAVVKHCQTWVQSVNSITVTMYKELLRQYYRSPELKGSPLS